jgi:hypothetical protein
MLLPERHYRARARAGFIHLAIVIVVLILVVFVAVDAIMTYATTLAEQMEEISDV